MAMAAAAMSASPRQIDFCGAELASQRSPAKVGECEVLVVVAILNRGSASPVGTSVGNAGEHTVRLTWGILE